MKFVDDCFDEGAPEFCVTGISAVERISRHQVRVSHFRRRKGENMDVVHTLWDATDWLKYCDMISRVCGQIMAEPPPGGADDQPARHAH